jgi:hypothetical protein
MGGELVVQRARSLAGEGSPALAGSGLLLAAVYVVVLSRQSTFETWSPLVVAPLLFLVSLPILARQANREGDRRLFWLLVLALALKLGGAFLRYYTTFALYQGRADAVAYHEFGVQISERFRDGTFRTGLESLTGTNFIRMFAGVVETFTGPSMLGAFLVFSWLAFWGLFLFYRAFTIAVPEGRRRSYAYLVFFLPGLLFWPSSIGKESWMIFALGVAAYGVARLLSGSIVRGLSTTGLGLVLAAFVRPHMAGLMAVALTVAYLIRRSPEEHRESAPVVKAIWLVPLIVVAVILIGRTNAYLAEKGIDTSRGPTEVVAEVGGQVSGGGSAFVPDVLESPQQAPIAVVTVLFRPFITEANNLQAYASAIEGTFLLVLTVARGRWLLAALRSMRRQSYVAFALIYTAMFVFAFSSLANFGLLVRQRTSLLPLFLVLLAVPPVRKDAAVVAGSA